MKQIKSEFAQMKFFMNGAYRFGSDLTQDEIEELCQTGLSNKFETIQEEEQEEEQEES